MLILSEPATSLPGIDPKETVGRGRSETRKEWLLQFVGDREKTGNNLIHWLPNLSACWNHLRVF